MITSKLIASTLLFLTGCTQTVYLYPVLPLPEEPELPVIAGNALVCLSNDTYEDLVIREQTRRTYANRLRSIIEAHNHRALESLDR